MQLQEKQMKETNKQYSGNCAPFTNCISEISNVQVDNGKDLDAVKSMKI